MPRPSKPRNGERLPLRMPAENFGVRLTRTAATWQSATSMSVRPPSQRKPLPVSSTQRRARLLPGDLDFVGDQQKDGKAAEDDPRQNAVRRQRGQGNSAHQDQNTEDAEEMLQPTVLLIVDGNACCHDPFSNGLTDERQCPRIGESITVAFRSAKVAFFRGAKGDYRTLVDSPVPTYSHDSNRYKISQAARRTSLRIRRTACGSVRFPRGRR